MATADVGGIEAVVCEARASGECAAVLRLLFGRYILEQVVEHVGP